MRVSDDARWTPRPPTSNDGSPTSATSSRIARAPSAPNPASSGEEDDARLEALSQSLLQRGGLVLSPWKFEVIPSVAYSNRIVQGLALVQTPEGTSTISFTVFFHHPGTYLLDDVKIEELGSAK